MVGSQLSPQAQSWLVRALLGAGAVGSFWYCFAEWHRNRVIRDTATSRVRSAAQGYIALSGRGLAPPGRPMTSPISGRHCTWWHYSIQERRGRNSWATIETGTSETVFFLDDGSGRCLVDPRGAEVHARDDMWYGSCAYPLENPPRGLSNTLANMCAKSDFRYRERCLLAGEPLYALGSFRTEGGVAAVDAEREVAQVLRSWKHDQKTLLDRFDANHDGLLSGEEWERVRQAAHDQVAASVGARPLPVPISVLGKPADGRIFLLVAGDELSLARRLRSRAAASIMVCIACCAALAWWLINL